jgi:HlyD family secretion protein
VQNVITYTVVVDVANPGGKLLPGMTANVKVIVAEKTNVLKVSNAALRFRPSEADSSTGSAPRTVAGKPDANVPAASAATAPTGESTRDRLARQLGLTEAQVARIDPILQQNREQRRVLREAGLSAADRKTRTRELREQTGAQIRQVLTPEQRDRYDALAAESAGGEDAGSTGRVWILGPDGKPVPITVSLGLSDGSATEVRQGDLKEGQHVLVGGTSPTSGRGTSGGRSEPRLRL